MLQENSQTRARNVIVWIYAGLAVTCLFVGIVLVSIPSNPLYGCYQYNCSYAFVSNESSYEYYQILFRDPYNNSRLLTPPTTYTSCMRSVWPGKVGNISACFDPYGDKSQCALMLPPNNTVCYTDHAFYDPSLCPAYLYCWNQDTGYAKILDVMLLMTVFVVISVLMCVSIVISKYLPTAGYHEIA